MWKNDFGHRVIKYVLLFCIGGLFYNLIEYIFRQWSHQSMFILGGIVFIFAGLQNEYTDRDVSFWKQLLNIWIFALSAEFITGCIVNLWLGMNVWDYSNMPGNILGQSCPQFAILFIPLCAIGIILDDLVRHWLFGEPMPKYNFSL